MSDTPLLDRLFPVFRLNKRPTFTATTILVYHLIKFIISRLSTSTAAVIVRLLSVLMII